MDSVIRGLRYQTTQRGLKGQKRKTVLDAAGYFARNRDRMKYDEYLAAGYPIGSGVVEGACRHLVKDRLERTGMRWLPSGAQAMLDLRATYLNGEWSAFWRFHVEREGRWRKRSAEEAESAESLLIGTRATDVGDRDNHGKLACLLEKMGTKKRSYCQE